ncbi:MAG: hypothetical protein GC159_00765 [Phycisphaera sp.]|nr:hypothetical protein [Phycisphaera sp.]
MEELGNKANRRMRRIIYDLKAYQVTGLDADEERGLKHLIAQQTIEALNTQDHPLNIELTELTQQIKDLAVATNAAAAVKIRGDLSPEQLKSILEAKQIATKLLNISGAELRHLLFMPHPGEYRSPWHGFWPLQLLLYTTATCCPQHQSALAVKLNLSAAHLKVPTKAAYEYSIKRWSTLQRVPFLRTAVDKLDVTADLRIHLVGRTLTQNGNTVTITETQARFLQILLDAAGDCVSLEDFRRQGVKHPNNMKYELVPKALSHGIQLAITPCNKGGYAISTC